jgi:hypothetical protein
LYVFPPVTMLLLHSGTVAPAVAARCAFAALYPRTGAWIARLENLPCPPACWA